jgi:hypothetical protein
MKKLSFLFVAAIGLAACQTAKNPDRMRLQFKADGKFKIAQFTDMHFVDGSPNSATTVATIKYVLETEKPDVAILTGDQAFDRPSRNVWLSQIARVFEENHTPFAVVMGNHDAETITRDSIFDLLSRSPYFIGEKGPEDIYGVGNYVLPVHSAASNKVAALLYCFDANDYPKDKNHGGYDHIHFDQIVWYRQQSQKFTQANGGQPLSALAFFHIPLREFNNVFDRTSTIGTRGEKSSPAAINSGIFASFIDMQDVHGVFVGHDHNSDFIGIEYGIALAYGRVTGADAYGDLERGSRIIELYEKEPNIFHTWIRTPSGVANYYYYPSGLTAEQEANATYLPAQAVTPTAQGVAYKYYEGKFKSTKEIASAKVVKTGKLANFSIVEASADDHFAYEFRTWLKIPESGLYCFYTFSDDGSKLYIDGKPVVDNDGSHSKWRATGIVALEAGFHDLQLLYFEDYMSQTLEVGFMSRNISERTIPDELLFLAE